MVTSTNDQLRIRQSRGHNLERLDHQFEPFVGSPFSERQNAVFRITAPGKVRIFRPARQDSMRS
jgi:hypothetical protein